MVDGIKEALLVFLGVALIVGISALIAWFLSFGLAYSFGYELGFKRTWVGMFTAGIVSTIVFSGIKFGVWERE